MYCRKFASVAHLDRAAASDAACGGFESRQAHHGIRRFYACYFSVTGDFCSAVRSSYILL